MDLHKFLRANHTDWPMGKMQTVHQSHLVSADMPITHPLLADGFLKSANAIHIIIHGPKPLKMTTFMEFKRKIAEVAQKNSIQVFDVRPGTLIDAISVSILAGRLQK